jgi:sugar (pentulose or hexulose) kinase
VFTGTSDNSACIFSLGTADDELTAVLGTWGVLCKRITQPLHDPRIMAESVYGNSWTLHSVIAGAGASVNWLRDHLCAHFRTEADERGIDIYEVINEHAAASPIGANGLYCNPQIMGDIVNYLLHGSYINISFATGINEMIRALYEGIAYEFKKAILIMDEATGSRTRRVRVTGGCSKSKLLLQILADVLDMEIVEVAPTPTCPLPKVPPWSPPSARGSTTTSKKPWRSG